MKTIKDIIDTRKGENVFIIGAGATIKEYQKQIDDFINETEPIIIGVNNMTDFWTPDYHLWTNSERFRTYGQNICENSKLLLGQNIPLKVINSIIGNRKYFLVNYTDFDESIPIGYKNGKIYGCYRTAGCLSIMIAHLMGASEINIVGMDGYSMHKHEDLTSGKESQHCYKKGFTDTANWKTCVKKDKIINGVLYNLQKHGINFKILTPTKYEDYYDNESLH